MSDYVWERCACGVRIVSVSQDEDDVRIAVASHNETPVHLEWRAVEDLRRKSKGPCICKGYNGPAGTSSSSTTSDAVPLLVPGGTASS